MIRWIWWFSGTVVFAIGALIVILNGHEALASADLTDLMEYFCLAILRRNEFSNLGDISTLADPARGG
jgi:hypothetical protein